jgi:hypothetical protein
MSDEIEVITRNDRGFHQYGPAFNDTYESEVCVVESSSAAEPCVWVFCTASMHRGAGDTAPHLNKEQAEHLIRCLQSWINEIPERWGDKP